MRTTFAINDALLAELRRMAAEQQKPFRRLVEETLQKGLATASRPAGRVEIRIPTFAMGLKAAYRGMSLNQLYDQVEADDVSRVAEK